MSDYGRRTKEFKRLADIMYRNAAARRMPCILCGQPIDYSLPYRDKHTGEVDPRAKSVQHIKSVKEYPHLAEALSNMAPAHLGCNWQAGTNPTTPADQLGTPSEDW